MAAATYDTAPPPAETARAPLRAQLSLPVVVLVVGGLYFLWVALLGTRAVVLRGLEPTVTVQDWAAFGAILMVVLLLLLVVDARRGPRAPVAHAAAAPRYAPMQPVGPPQVADELVVTAESWQGRRVLEYSRPPKSEHPRAVYAKCVVPIDDQLALRLEDLVAEGR